MKAVLPTLALLAGITAAQADDGLYIADNGNEGNLVSSEITGADNSLYVDQTYDGSGLRNQVKLTFAGDLNGGPLHSSFTGATARSGLAPGDIVQVGHDNLVDLFIRGNSNLFAAAQIGSANTLTAQITGNYNQTAVYQMGIGNVAAIVQNGNGNSLTIIQRAH
jgi:hypothetical protein